MKAHLWLTLYFLLHSSASDLSLSLICVHVCMLSHFSRVQLCETLWPVARYTLLSMGFFRQEHWSGFPCPLPGDLPNPGIELVSLMSPALAGRFFTTWEAHQLHIYTHKYISTLHLVLLSTLMRSEDV